MGKVEQQSRELSVLKVRIRATLLLGIPPLERGCGSRRGRAARGARKGHSLCSTIGCGGGEGRGSAAGASPLLPSPSPWHHSGSWFVYCSSRGCNRHMRIVCIGKGGVCAGRQAGRRRGRAGVDAPARRRFPLEGAQALDSEVRMIAQVSLVSPLADEVHARLYGACVHAPSWRGARRGG